MQGPMYFEFYFFSLIESPLQIFVVVLTKDSNQDLDGIDLRWNTMN